jgi:hypothetical protein
LIAVLQITKSETSFAVFDVHNQLKSLALKSPNLSSRKARILAKPEVNLNYKCPGAESAWEGGSMSNSYVLNLTMGNPANSSSSDAQAGRFDSNNVDPTSKIWYQLNAPWPTPTVGSQVTMSTNPAANLQAPGFPDADAFNCNLGDLIYVRVVPDSSWGTPPAPPTLVTLSVNFGRIDTAHHDGDTIPSPFLAPSLPSVPATAFALLSASPTNTTSTDWIIYLGPAAQNALGGAAIPPGGATKMRTYSFIVAAVASNSSGVVGNYGHDPQMIVIG